MKQFLITPDDFLDYMSEATYKTFLNNIRIKNKISEDDIIWIIGEFSEKEK